MTKRNATLMLTALALLLVIGAWTGSFLARASVAPSVRDQLIGSWNLVSRVSTLADGSVLPDPNLGGAPKGCSFTIARDTSPHSFPARAVL
jgi:hypothetical protein